ncbi:prolyl 4-hydroxylase subunit alpha-1-like protein [Leptotrombidium deliense]|uniref:procollagen-proline 4-dioxygenase n=1 Tax=Leptotrombidium deliense TaxID=299467 RepID=A0A443SMI8_9ACAR|nr:prolyl 4-hydroxylase subunit alpha-1-like protein [Leptotrombidium deliense]
MKPIHLFYLFIVCFTFERCCSSEDLYTALVDLEKLLETERQVINSVDSYLKLEDERLSQLRFIRDNYMQMHQIASRDIHSYLANPVNAYILVKRLTTDWKTVESLMTSGPTEIAKAVFNNLTDLSNHETFPSPEDLSGAVDALLRLQDTYKLDTSTLAKGKIPAGKYSKTNEFIDNQFELTAGDCFELGRHSYINGDHYHTVLWMQEAIDRLDDEPIKTANRADILEYLAFSNYQQGNIRHALHLTAELLEIFPSHPRASGNKLYYESLIGKSTSSKKRGDEGDDVPIDETISESANVFEPREESEREAYESLCRGEKRISARTDSQLKCYYLDTTKKPYLRLSRIKVEEAFKKPKIVVFLDIMSDFEIEVIKNLSTPRLKRATVQNYKTGDLEVARYRISKSAWLKGEDHAVVARVNQRIEDITGLTTQTAEELQVVNYGIGGHYEPHYDFARREEKNAFKSLGTGNRIATWLNYMSDVDAGGATVFPILGITVWPRKGSAAFWYNLYKSGEGDLLTRHAACPVLVGSKWVSNKWFHERGQEFLRPCGLKINS